MQNILQCICQDSNQQSYKVLFIMSPSLLYNTLKSASEAIFLGYFVPRFLERAFQRLN